MSGGRIGECFSRLAERRRKGFIPFVTAGDPEPGATVPILHALVQGGADLLELGMPFSDPMADGPVIQRSSERALAQNIDLERVFGMVREFRAVDPSTPLVLMGYLNPLEQMGYSEFCRRAQAAGVDGALIVDLPVEEAAPLRTALRQHRLDCILLAAPTTSAERLQRIGRQGSGFLYCVTLKGVTGSDRLQLEQVAGALQRVRAGAGRLPLAIGFGVKDAAGAQALAPLGEAVVVGSALVERLAEAEQPTAEAERFARSLRDALDRVPGGPVP